MSYKRSLFAVGIAVALSFSGSVGAFVVDGDLSDWLQNAPTASVDDWTPFDGIKYQVDDDRRNYLNPGWGGQAYDAEAIYVALDSDNLYVAVITGLAPGTNIYPSGDILIDGAFDISGGPRSFDVAIVVEDRAGFSVGDVVLADPGDFGYGLWNGPKDQKKASEAPTQFFTDHPTIVNSGTLLSDATNRAEVFYGAGSYNGDVFNGDTTMKLGAHDTQGKHKHFVIEAMIPLDLFELDGGGNVLEPQFLVHWNMQCNNDFVEVDPQLGGDVPAPPVWSLLTLGMAGVLGYRRRSRR